MSLVQIELNLYYEPNLMKYTQSKMILLHLFELLTEYLINFSTNFYRKDFNFIQLYTFSMHNLLYTFVKYDLLLSKNTYKQKHDRI